MLKKTYSTYIEKCLLQKSCVAADHRVTGVACGQLSDSLLRTDITYIKSHVTMTNVVCMQCTWVHIYTLQCLIYNICKCTLLRTCSVVILYTLPEVSHSTWTWMVGRVFLFWGPAYLQGRTVSFREVMYISLRIQICPQKGVSLISPKILCWGWDWDHLLILL